MNKQNLLETLVIQTASDKETKMRNHIKKFVKAVNNTRIDYDHGNIYVTKGNAAIYPCIAAHMDTVHDLYEDFKIYEANGNLFALDGQTMQQVGIGGDDKVGVFIALEMLLLFDHIKVVFFTNEEIGCVGSGNADLSFFDNCSLVLQCDRRGNSDFIQRCSRVDLFGKDFEIKVAPFLARYEYEVTDGFITDVVRLKELGLSIAVANISCGYYEPHTNREYVNLADVETCHDLVYDLLAEFGHQRQEHEFDPFLDDWHGHAIIPHETQVGFCDQCDGAVFFDEFNSFYCNRCSFYLDESEFSPLTDPIIESKLVA